MHRSQSGSSRCSSTSSTACPEGPQESKSRSCPPTPSRPSRRCTRNHVCRPAMARSKLRDSWWRRKNQSWRMVRAWSERTFRAIWGTSSRVRIWWRGWWDSARPRGDAASPTLTIRGRFASTPRFVQRYQHRARVDLLADGHQELTHHAVVRRDDLVLHFHGFENYQCLALPYRLAGGDAHGQDFPRHRRVAAAAHLGARRRRKARDLVQLRSAQDTVRVMDAVAAHQPAGAAEIVQREGHMVAAPLQQACAL